jgi:uncharacterized protein Usg
MKPDAYIQARENGRSDISMQMLGYGLTTARILYHLP